MPQTYKRKQTLSVPLPANLQALISHMNTGVKTGICIGSTAIHGIWAKNIVDVMVEISEKADMKEIARILEQNGFIRMSDEKRRITLNKGYTKEGFADKVYHIHLRYAGDNDELYFRDYLNEHPQIAREYEALKLELWKRYEHNRDAYTDAKTDFIRKWTTVQKHHNGTLRTK